MTICIILNIVSFITCILFDLGFLNGKKSLRHFIELLIISILTIVSNYNLIMGNIFVSNIILLFIYISMMVYVFDNN